MGTDVTMLQRRVGGQTSQCYRGGSGDRRHNVTEEGRGTDEVELNESGRQKTNFSSAACMQIYNRASSML